MYWLNIDNPTKTATIHTETCRYMRGRNKTPNDGGWHLFDSLTDVQSATSGCVDYTVKECGHCIERNE